MLFGAHCGYSPYNCDEDHYEKECARNETYEKRLYDFVSNKQLPENMGMVRIKHKYTDLIEYDDWTSIKNSFCNKLGNESYENTEFFSSHPSVFVNIVKKFHKNSTIIIK